jgi:hypothetical protein
MAIADTVLPDIDVAQLAGTVRLALAAPAAIPDDDWTCRPLPGGYGDGVGIWRLAGTARVGSDRRAWTLVLKALPGSAGAPAWVDPCREARVYRSGLLADLPGGLVAPRCYAVEDRPDGQTWLWMEAIADDPTPWSPSQFARAAEALGRFNGAFLAGTPLPAAAWLSRGWLRLRVETSGPTVAELSHLADIGANPVMRQAFPPSRVAALTRLWDERAVCCTALDRVPQTFCHLDAFRGNMLGRRGAAGKAWPVVIDWAFAGIGAVGQELAPLVLMAFPHEDRAGLRRLDAICFAAYLRGLRAAGWDGDASAVRLGFTSAAALRYSIGALRLFVGPLADASLHPLSERTEKRSMSQIVAALTELWAFEDELAAEARSLLPSVA